MTACAGPQRESRSFAIAPTTRLEAATELAGGSATLPDTYQHERAVVDEDTAAERPELPVVRLGPGASAADASGGAALNVGSEAELFGEPAAFQSQRYDEDTAFSDALSQSTDAAASTPAQQAAQRFEQALKLAKSEHYDQALDAFSGFLVRYPGHSYADRAMFWRGACYAAVGNDAQAARQFEGLIARFPRSRLVPDALLKLGLAQRRRGRNAAADLAFEQLRTSHPLSAAVRQIPMD